jgi:hypothetical protein
MKRSIQFVAKPLSFVAVLAAMLFVFVRASNADELQDKLASFQQVLVRAKIDFRKTVSSIPAYQDAKKHLDECSQAVEALQTSKDAAAIDAAIKAKIAARKTLSDTADALELKDKGVIAAQDRIDKIKQ